MLNELTEISEEAAIALSKHEGHLHLAMAGLALISGPVAEALSGIRGSLNLNGLVHISDASAESFSKFDGGLTLNGLTQISDKASKALSKHKGWLELNGLTRISDTNSEFLIEHQGVLQLQGLFKISATSRDIFKILPVPMSHPRAEIAAMKVPLEGLLRLYRCCQCWNSSRKWL
jgi:hypothetical protein